MTIQETDRGDPLIEYLKQLAATQRERPESRAVLASLRASLREERSYDALRVVMPFVKRGSARQTVDEDEAAMIAALFATHPEDGPQTLASALRMQALKANGREVDPTSSVALRFRALLDATREDLPVHLRHAVSLMASKRASIDWSDLRRSIRDWGHPEDFVRRRWARDFWAPVPAEDPTNPDE